MVLLFTFFLIALWAFYPTFNSKCIFFVVVCSLEAGMSGSQFTFPVERKGIFVIVVKEKNNP